MDVGPSLSLAEPLWKIGRRSWTEALTFRASEYSHTTEAFGGYWNATFRERANLSELEDWLEKLGYHFTLWSEAHVPVWEGFVNRVSIVAGDRALGRGPLLDIGNKVYLIYSSIDYSTDPPSVGQRVRTPIQEDADSQMRWGIRYKVLQTGGVADDIAPVIVSRFLDERAEPRVTKGEGGGGPEVTVELLGYVHLLDYPYNDETTGEVDLSNPDGTGKIQLILAAEENGIFSTDYLYMAANPLQVGRYENKDRQALSLLKSLTSRGDAAFSRYLFGIYAGLQARYNAAPTDTAYHKLLRDPRQRITRPGGDEVRPWEVLPGRWLFYPDFNVGRTQPAERRLDSRYEFLESVTYTAPYQVTHRGGKTDTISQVLAQLGLAGIGA